MVQPHSTFAQWLDAMAARAPGHPALIDREIPVSYQELRMQVRQLAAGLAHSGVGPGDRVALWLPNCAAWVVSFLACARLGALVLAVNTRFRAVELADIIGRGRAEWLIFWPDFKGIDFGGILSQVDDESVTRLRGVVALSGDHEQASADAAGTVLELRGRPVHAYSALCASQAPVPPVAVNAGVLCFTTSGTTSKPKFVVHDQRTLLRHGDAIAQAFGYDDTSVVLASTPFCGAFGFATLSGALVRGVTLVCEPVFDAVRSRQSVSAHGISHTYANNEALAAMIGKGGTTDFGSVRLFGFANFTPGADDLLDLARQAHVPLAGLYGSSELQALMAVQPCASIDGDTSVRYQPGGMLVHPEARVRARDPLTGSVLPHGASGELEISSPSLMMGYLDDPDATARALTADGYFKTGDLGITVSDRQFVFQTRMGDSLRLAGFLVNPAEIEHVVESLDGISACQVVGAERDGKIVPYAFVLLAPGAHENPHAWSEACRGAMAGFKVPAGFMILDEFPSVLSANSVKIQKNRLREMANAALALGHGSGR